MSVIGELINYIPIIIPNKFYTPIAEYYTDL